MVWHPVLIIVSPGSYGFVVKSARPSKIGQSLQKARKSQNITIVDYPRAVLETGHDDERLCGQN